MLPTLIGIQPTQDNIQDNPGLYVFLNNETKELYVGASDRIQTAIKTITGKMERSIGRYKEMKPDQFSIHYYQANDVQQAADLLKEMETQVPEVVRL